MEKQLYVSVCSALLVLLSIKLIFEVFLGAGSLLLEHTVKAIQTEIQKT